MRNILPIFRKTQFLKLNLARVLQVPEFEIVLTEKKQLAIYQVLIINFGNQEQQRSFSVFDM